MNFKETFRPWVPPGVLGLLRQVYKKPSNLIGDYPTWEAAAIDATGYGSEEILRRVIAGTNKVVTGEAAYERDSVVFAEIEYSWPLLAALLLVAAELGSLQIIDVGGSLGSTWRQNRKYLNRLRVPQVWKVVEQEEFVLAGRSLFADRVLRFEHTIEEAGRDGVDAILFCGSLSYLPDPQRFLDQAASTQARYLIIDRLPVISGSTDRIAVQKVMEPIYSATYPVRLFSAQHLMSYWLRDWQTIEGWKCDMQPDEGVTYQGFFLERR